MSQSNFVLVVVFAGTLGFHVVVTDFQLGAHDRRPFVHRTDTHGVPGRTVLAVQIHVLVHCHVHQAPVIVEVHRAVIQNADHAAVVINAGPLRVAAVPGGHCVSGVLNHKLVEAAPDRLSMFTGPHPAVFRRAVFQAIVILRVSTAVIDP